MPKPSIDRVSRFVMVTAELDASIEMFEAFDAKLLVRRTLDEAYAVLLGVPGSRIEEAMLRLGEQDLSLICFNPPGRPYPVGSTSTDLWFQHFAIIVSDMPAAYEKLRAFGRIQAISERGPQTLPPLSGSVSAFKFRDAEGHPLELLAFPAGTAPEYWATKRHSGVFLGLDHSASAVADTAHSMAFFESALGLALGQRSENAGPEQSRLDGVQEARVTVSGLMPRTPPPHVELLAYHVGPRRPIDRTTASNDIAATFLVLETRQLAAVAAALVELEARFVSPGIVVIEDGVSALMVLDPDGHRLCVVERR